MRHRSRRRTSLERDRTTKLRHCARGGIPQYVILDLADHSADEYLVPNRESATYAKRARHLPGATIALRLAGDATLAVSLGDLFPRR